MNNEEKKQFKVMLFRVAAIVAVACIVILFFFRTSVFLKVLSRSLVILEPFIYGFAIAYLLNPICAFFERSIKRVLRRFGLKPKDGTLRMVGIILSLLVMIAVLALLLIAVLPSLIQSISTLISQIPQAMKKLQEWLQVLDQNEAMHEIVGYIQQAISTFTEKLQNILKDEILPNLETYVSNVTSSFMGLVNFCKNFGLGCIVAAYLLGGKEKFLAQARLILYALLPQKTARWIGEEFHYTDRTFSGFITGKLLDSLIIGLLCYIFTTLTDMPYAILVSVIVGVTNIIPFFGPYIGAIPSALLILTVSPIKCLVFVIFIIVLQQFDGNILGPAILGDRLGISGIWILFSILLFSSIWGFTGMVIGVPVFAVLYDMIRKGIYYLLRKRDVESMITVYERNFPREPEKKQSPKRKMFAKKNSKNQKKSNAGA